MGPEYRDGACIAKALTSLFGRQPPVSRGQIRWRDLNLFARDDLDYVESMGDAVLILNIQCVGESGRPTAVGEIGILTRGSRPSLAGLMWQAKIGTLFFGDSL